MALIKPKNQSPKELYRKLQKKAEKPFRLSLRYKLAFPVLVLVTLMLLLLFRTTFNTVRTVVITRSESKLKAIAEVFAETVKVPLILKNQQVLLANVEWMAKRPDVIEVRVEDSEGVTVGGNQTAFVPLPPQLTQKNFYGVQRLPDGNYSVAVPIQAHDRKIGRVLILFGKLGFEGELHQIFQEQLMVAFIMALFLAGLIAGVTWVAIRPLFILKRTAEEILAGDMTARANVNSFDEIQELGDAFNEMVSRLAKSLDNLRARTEALEESEEKYRLIIENATDIIFALTPQGDLILLNKGFSGCTREELLVDGLPLFLALHDEESRKRFQDAMSALAETKKPVFNISITHIHRGNQAEIFYLTNLTPVLDHEGNIRLVQGMMRDVTELKRIEVMKDSLIRDVAHELKTPTAKFEMAVTWFEKELSKNHELDKYKQVIEILKVNNDRLMRTIMSIMDLSRLESGMDRLVGVDLNLNEVLEQVCRDMEPICHKRKLKLEHSFSKYPLHMRGDKDMLYRLFVNLITNATKFTEIGGIKITSKKEDDKILVTVTDTGMGIEKEHIEKVFERFFQKTASSMGIGVGLTICRDIAALHQGRIWAESEGLGKGATFKVEFPLGEGI